MRLTEFRNIDDSRVCLATELGWHRVPRETILAIDALIVDGRAIVRLAAFDGEDDDRVLVTICDAMLSPIGTFMVCDEGMKRIEIEHLALPS